MPFANLPDAKVHYEWSGAEHLPVLVLCNGLGTNLSMWDRQVAQFSEHFRVLRYDGRGHGQSEVTPGPYTIEQLSRDVVRLLDALNIGRAHFCGLSMGGLIGMFLATNEAKHFRKIILSSTAAKIATADVWNTRIQSVQSGGMQAVASTVMARWFTSSYRAAHPEDMRSVLAMLESTDPQGYTASCAAVRDSDQRDTVKDIQLPCLVVVGAEDPGTPPPEARFLTNAISGSIYAEFPASHLCNIEVSDKFNHRVLQFLLA